MEFIIACVLSFAVTAVVGKFLVPFLRRLKAGQSIREDGPTWHMSKQGTPTMGGLMFIAGISVAVFACGWRPILRGSFAHLYVLLFALVFGAIGYVDDYRKVRKQQNLGLTAIQKFLLQLAAAVAFLCLMRYEHLVAPNLYLPFLNRSVALPWVVYLIFAAFVVVGAVNAVNITDGVDGLAASVTTPVALFFVIVAGWWQYQELGIFAAALVGGLLGFLLYNFHPAKVFMGDTGSLFLGGAVAAMAFAYDMPLILIPVGVIYIAETLSDIIQVTYFKLTHGKRVFKMAPLHHHFEMCGWSEKKLVFVFTSITIVGCVLALWGVAGRFGA